jgi:hypothetical protein
MPQLFAESGLLTEPVRPQAAVSMVSVTEPSSASGSISTGFEGDALPS